jgi:1-acyl-sn-glycerol-3-phosphate acyltransferase
MNTNYLPSRNRPRYIIAGNHASGADAYLILAIMTGRYWRRVYAVAHERSFRDDTFEKLFLMTLEMIPRIGRGQELINKMADYLLKNRTIVIPPEGMTSNKVMKGYTGVMRLYWLVNHQLNLPYRIPIIPIVSIGANKAYPITFGEDGKYHPKKTGIIARFGKPIYYEIPEHPSKEWFRQKTDELMDHIAVLALQKEGAIESWKLKQFERQKSREYKL